MRLQRNFLLGALALFLASFGHSVSAQPASTDLYRTYIYGEPAAPGEDWLLAYGGRLYDLWWAPLGKETPETTNPSYPKNGPLKGAATWRCVSCHGWDYRGNPTLGIPSLRGDVGRDPAEIAKIIRNSTHRYTPDMIPDEALKRLALFVSKGQVDMTALIDSAGHAKGNPDHGRDLYQNVCAICHDYDGKAYIEGEQEGLDSLAAVANAVPREALHKMINGQPSADMVSLRVLGPHYAADILAYAQSLKE